MYYYTIQAWVDRFKTWHRDMLKKINAGVETGVDLLDGAEIVEKTIAESKQTDQKDKAYLGKVIDLLRADNDINKQILPIINGELYDVMVKYEYELAVIVEREKAGFCVWYELFPRSTADKPGKYGNFRTTAKYLPYIADMGFDILYLPPVHPIGYAPDASMACVPRDAPVRTRYERSE